MKYVPAVVDFKNLRNACQRMIELIDAMENPETASSGMKNFGFHMIANEIRFEIDGEESCIPEVRRRAAEVREANALH